MVGMAGVEPATSCPPDKRAARLRHIPHFLLAASAAGPRPHWIPDGGGSKCRATLPSSRRRLACVAADRARLVQVRGLVRLTEQIQFAGFVQWRQRMRSILVNLRLHRPKRCRLPLTYTWYWMVDTVGIEPTTAGLQGQLAPLVHACPMEEAKWTDRDSTALL